MLRTKLCVYVGKYCMLSLCVWSYCMLSVRVWGRRREEEAAPGIQNQNKNPTQSCGEEKHGQPMFSDLWFNVHILIQLKLWSILSNKKIHQAATLNQRAASNCRFFNFTLFFCYCCSFWVLRLPVDVSISPLLAMSYWNSSQWNSWDNQWQRQQSPPPPPPSSNPPVSLPSHWRSTSQCWDDQVQYGYRVYRSSQPTAWSRKRNLAGQDPLSVPLSHLTRHGPDEAALRALSGGRFVGIICAKSVAESVFWLPNFEDTPRSRDRYRCYGWKPSSPVGPSAGHSQSHGQTDWVYGTFSSIHSR